MAVRSRSTAIEPGSARRSARAAGGGPAPAIFNPIITMNSGGIIQSASDSVEQVFGWTPAELFGRNMKVLIPEPRRSALDRYLDRYRHSDSAKVLERTRRFEAVRKDGSPISIELSMSRAELPSVGSPYFIGIIRDVSRQIDVSGEFTRDSSALRRLIMQQTRELATANLRLHLADRLASLGTLAAGLGHDMNNMLLPVRARLSALEHAQIPAAALAHVRAVGRSVSYLQHLSDGLHFLALDPDGSGVEPGEGVVTDLSLWWKQVGGLLRKAVPQKVKLVASFSKALRPVKIAPHWLTQGVLNLLVNAGEAISERRRNGIVHISAIADQSNKNTTLSVSDNGRGMSVDVQRRAFDLFFSTKPRGMGTGLGLAMVRKVAIRAGGHVTVVSAPGKGSTVSMVLPTARSGRSDSSNARAVITVKDRRAAALIAQVLSIAGVDVRTERDSGNDSAALWVTEPTSRSLREAERSKVARRPGTLILLGQPRAADLARWEALGATIVHPADDFGALRQALGHALHVTDEKRDQLP